MTLDSHDANGALTKSDDSTTVNVYTYDCDGYLTAFDTTGTENDATYTYDAGKRRIAKTVDSTTTKYFLEGANVIADYDGSDTLLATYITTGPDSNLSQTRSGSTYYYMRDGLGSIRNLVDANEATQNTYDYYAFGKELGTWTQSVTNRYTYTAREHDPESTQYYYRARYYNGGGRFNRRDPVRSGTNIYMYVKDNPIRHVDPRGLKEKRPETNKHYTCGCDNVSEADPEKINSDKKETIGWKTLKLKVLKYQGAHNDPVGPQVELANAIWEQCCVKIALVGTENVDQGESKRILGADYIFDDMLQTGSTS